MKTNNGFRPGEIVQVQGREFPVVGGRLRILHERHGEGLSIETQIVEFQTEVFAVVTARVTTGSGVFTGTGAASASRDPKLVDALLELAETRAVARACRFGGIGVECCGFEELGAGEVLGGEAPRRIDRPGNGDRRSGNGNRRPSGATGAQKRAIRSLAFRLGQDVDEAVSGVVSGMVLEDLTLPEASTVIDQLKARAGNGNGHANHGRR